jgi:hypothetical protein
MLTICHADLFLYSIGNVAICRISLAIAAIYENRLKIFCVIISILLSEKK